MIVRVLWLALLAANAFLVSAGPGMTQSYPNRPITMVVPFGPGGPTDFVARHLSKSIENDVRQPVVVENAPGGGGAAAAGKFEHAAGDGYTLLLWVSSANALRSMRATPVATVAVQGNVVYGIVAPVGTPDSVVVRLNSAVNKALANSTDLKSALAKLGAEAKTSTPKESAVFIGTAK